MGQPIYSSDGWHVYHLFHSLASHPGSQHPQPGHHLQNPARLHASAHRRHLCGHRHLAGVDVPVKILCQTARLPHHRLGARGARRLQHLPVRHVVPGARRQAVRRPGRRHALGQPGAGRPVGRLGLHRLAEQIRPEPRHRHHPAGLPYHWREPGPGLAQLRHPGRHLHLHLAVGRHVYPRLPDRQHPFRGQVGLGPEQQDGWLGRLLHRHVPLDPRHILWHSPVGFLPHPHRFAD